jgi:3,4-dihydroxy 2-butanone 4-phosphate synthase/GTP cyclohydrolase II
VLSEIVADSGAIPSEVDVRRFAAEYGMVVVSVADVVRYRRSAERRVRLTDSHMTCTPQGDFEVCRYENDATGDAHLALRYGELGDGEDVLVRVHSECVDGDVFGSRACGCAEALAASLESIATEGRGVLVYLRGRDEREPASCGRPASGDARAEDDAWVTAEILAAEGVRSVRRP